MYIRVKKNKYYIYHITFTDNSGYVGAFTNINEMIKHSEPDEVNIGEFIVMYLNKYHHDIQQHSTVNNILRMLSFENNTSIIADSSIIPEKEMYNALSFVVDKCFAPGAAQYAYNEYVNCLDILRFDQEEMDLHRILFHPDALINSFIIPYYDDFEDEFALIRQVENLYDLFWLEIMNLHKTKIKIGKCIICGKYYISHKRKLTCDNPSCESSGRKLLQKKAQDKYRAHPIKRVFEDNWSKVNQFDIYYGGDGINAANWRKAHKEHTRKYVIRYDNALLADKGKVLSEFKKVCAGWVAEGLLAIKPLTNPKL